MNKNYRKNILIGALSALSLISFSGCSDSFLNEDYKQTPGNAYFETQDGLDALVTGMYASVFKFHYNYIWAFTSTNYGVDEMTIGNSAGEAHWNNYTSSLNSAEAGSNAPLWDNMYSGIATANLGIQNIPSFYDKSSPSYNTRLGECYFVRGFNYFKLLRQFGGVVLKLKPSTSPEAEFTRSTAEETFAQIFLDLEEAYKLLPDKAEQTGRITKSAAAHFLAKAHLFRASELNSDWNGNYKAADLEAVVKYGKEVIAAHPLATNFVDLWNYTTPDGANEKNSEVVLAAQFSNNTATQGRYGNQVHLYYPSIYQTTPGMIRDIAGGREFSYMRSTNFALDVYDRVNDSRFWKSFITSYTCNNPKGAPRWDTIFVDRKPVWIPDASLIESVDPETKKVTYKQKIKGGEEAIRYIVNSAGDDRYTNMTANTSAATTYVRYFKGESQSYTGAHGNYGSNLNKPYFVALSKFRDGSRDGIASQFGRRDGILARSAEDYLMVAEALGRQGKYAEALPYINDLRRRAGYSEGENRAKNIDGGQAYKTNPAITLTGDGGAGTGFSAYSELNTYFESNNMLGKETTASTKNAMIFNSVSDIFNSPNEFYTELGCTSDADKFLCFIMNERSRELMGELMRWEDLARVKGIEKRWKVFNDGSLDGGGSFVPEKHYLRPIPQSFLDAVEKGGKPLSAEDKQAMQNPGW